MKRNILLFEDHFLEDMSPVVLTRPAFAVTCAVYTLYDIVAMVTPNVSYIVREHLKKTAAHAYKNSPLEGKSPVLLINASVVPDVRHIERLQKLFREGNPFICTSGQRVAAAMLPPTVPIPKDISFAVVTPFLLNLGLPLRDEELSLTIDYPFQIIRELPKVFSANIQRKISDGCYKEVRPKVFADENVQIAPNVAFYPDNGPILFDSNAKIMDFISFHGPVYVGQNTRVNEHALILEHTSIGNTCKVGGDVEVTVIEAFTNKQRHGFLGHAYIGSWVNLGAGTSNSNLKNTYGTIRIEHRGKRLDTGMQFFGCVVGDYAKSAINTGIFTGKSIGVASMLYGYVGQNVPSFSNYSKSFGQVTECSLDQTVLTQNRMFARRNIEQTVDDIALLEAVFSITRDERLISSEQLIL